MQQAGSQLVVTCMEDTDNITLARAIQQYGLKIKQLWLNGYDQTLLNKYSSLMQGVYLNNTGTLPFESANTSRYGNTYSGMQAYIAAMKKYEPAYTYNGVALQGWQSAALMVAGIKAAGQQRHPGQRDQRHQQDHRLHRCRHLRPGGLDRPPHRSHLAELQRLHPGVADQKFVPVFGKGKQVFVCVGKSVSKPVPVTPPPGTPGA